MCSRVRWFLTSELVLLGRARMREEVTEEEKKTKSGKVFKKQTREQRRKQVKDQREKKGWRTNDPGCPLDVAASPLADSLSEASLSSLTHFLLQLLGLSFTSTLRNLYFIA